MTEDPPSRLLAELAVGGGESAWRELDARYRPGLQGFAARLGLLASDAEDVAQEVLTALAEACRDGAFVAGRGSLSAWLFAVARDRVRAHWRRAALRAGARGESALGRVPDEAHLSDVWEAEWRAAILREALRRVRAEGAFGAGTLAAFQGLALEGRDAAAVGAELGLTANAVHQAKFRVAERLRAIVDALERADHVTPSGAGGAR
ncbi:MAG: sigma-70 family RNA polymerase sigma factor [Planctomycetota bacterium]